MSEKVNKGRLKAAGILALVLAAMIVLLLIFELSAQGRKKSLDYMQAGDRWSADGSEYAVINAYMEDSCAVDGDQLSQWEYLMDSALTEAAIESKEGGRPWTWSASFETQLTPMTENASASAVTTVCAGDFFIFHTPEFICGSGFSTDGYNPMGVVLDDDLAWKLFGSVNVVGMPIDVGGREYIVTGVIKPESEKGVYGHTYGDSPRMFMSGAGYAKLGECRFTVYETALPDPVKSFAKNIFDSVVRLNEENSEVIEVTDRFSLKSRFSNMKELKYSWIRLNRIEYPYFENEARVYDYRSARLMIIEIIAAAVGAAALLGAVVMLVISGYSPITSLKNLFTKAKKTSESRKNKPKEVLK